MQTESTLQNLAQLSIQKSLTPKQLISLYKKNGFTKNARGKAWTVSAVYQHQLKARKESEMEEQKQVIETPLIPGPSVADIARIMDASFLDKQTKFELIRRVIAGEKIADDVVCVAVEDNLLKLTFGSLYESAQDELFLTKNHALSLLSVVEKIRDFVESQN